MKILIVSRFENWMVKTQLSHLSKAFNTIGHDVRFLDCSSPAKSLFSFLINEKKSIELRHLKLESEIKAINPDLLIFCISELLFNFSQVKSYYKGVLAVYDWDGPNWVPYKDMSWIKSIDFLFTVSKFSQRELKKQGITSFYLPQGIDPDFYSKRTIDSCDIPKYTSHISFIGRLTPRRIEYFSEILDSDLKLWVRRIGSKKKYPPEILKKSIQYNSDELEEELVKICNNTNLYINIIREPMLNPPTILSIWTLAVPCCGTCLATEWVEELDEAFEDGKEILVIRSKEQLVELVKKYSIDIEKTKQIGINGRMRVLSSHTHEIRAKEFIKNIK